MPVPSCVSSSVPSVSSVRTPAPRRAAPLLRLACRVQVAAMCTPPERTRARRCGGERGQATAEYALVLIGAAMVALLLIAWASKTDRIGKLFDFVIDRVRGNAS